MNFLPFITEIDSLIPTVFLQKNRFREGASEGGGEKKNLHNFKVEILYALNNETQQWLIL